MRQTLPRKAQPEDWMVLGLIACILIAIFAVVGVLVSTRSSPADAIGVLHQPPGGAAGHPHSARPLPLFSGVAA